MQFLRTLILSIGLLISPFWGTYAGKPDHPISSNHALIKFVENKGQWHSDIRYKAEVPAGKVYFGQSEFFFTFVNQWEHTRYLEQMHDHGTQHDDHDEHLDYTVHGHNFFMRFDGCNETAVISGKNPYSDKSNYFIGNDPLKWATDVQAFQQIYYQNIYDNIDLRVNDESSTMKYEFIIRPEADAQDIKIDFSGVDALKINQKGQLEIKTSINTLIENTPYAYQIINGRKVKVDCHFQLNGNTLTYELGKYKKKFPLIIDPQLIFSTSSGSTADNWGNTACFDDDGNLYTGGTIFVDRGDNFTADFNGFPTTVGAFQTSYSWNGFSAFINVTDLGISKYDSSGTNLLYSTYIGGIGCDVPTSTIVDSNGELVILCITSSADFPGAINTFSGGTTVGPGTFHFFNGGTDISVLRLSANGNAIIASRYMGGTSNDGLMTDATPLTHNYGDHFRGDLNLDSDGNIYVASTTSSSNFPTANAYQSTYGGGELDAVVFKLSSNLTTIEWSTFLGGSGTDAAYSIQRDSLNNVIVAGGTTGSSGPATTEFPTTTGVLNETELNDENDIDGFVSYIYNAGDSLIASTYLGTENYDQVYFVQIDGEESVYVLGQTQGQYKPTSGAYSVVNGGQIIHKMSKMLDSTYFISTFGSDNPDSLNIVPNISPTAFLVNECGNMFVSGWGGEVNDGYNGGETRNMFISSDAWRNEAQTDGSDFYLYVLQAGGVAPIYGTYFGGDATEHVDGGTSRFDKRGIVYQSVCANCGWVGGGYPQSTFPVFPDDGSQATYPKHSASLNCNNAVFKFDLANLEAMIQKPSGCQPLTVTFQNQSVGGSNFTWKWGDGTETTTPTAVPVSHTYDTTGTYTVWLIARDFTTCVGVDSTSTQITVNGQPPNERYQDTTCINSPITLGAGRFDTLAENSYMWSPSTFLDNPLIKNPTSTPTSSIRYIVTITDSIGCVQVDTVDVTVDDIIPDATWNVLGNCAGAPRVVFQNQTTGFEPLSYSWDFGDGGTSTDKDPNHQYAVYDTFTVVLDVTNGNCSASASFEVSFEEPKSPNVITPNNDGFNDEYVIDNIEGTGDWRFEVFNRWGERVYLNTAYDNSWSGKNESDGALKEGTYYYLITSPDGTTCKGWVEILR